MELKGLKGRGNPTASAIYMLTGETVKATKKQKLRALELIKAELELLKPVIEEENRLGRPLTEQELALHEEDPKD